MTRRVSLSLLSLLALSCHRVPATLPETSTEQAGALPVFAESPPPPRPSASAIAPMTSEASSLYSCWFEHPYEWMFSRDSPTVQVAQGNYGMLMGGISGILYYGHFNECAGRLVGSEPRSYSDHAPIGELAGVSVTVANSSLPFESVNPQIITWARTRLLPGPEETLDGIPVQLAYDRVFSRFFRMMGESLFFVLETSVIHDESTKYIKDVTTRKIDGITWLEQRYASIPAHGGSADGTTMTAPMAAGFWLRRELDGTLPDCWHALRDVYERYDPAWLDDLRGRYPKAASAVGQLPDRMISPN